LGTGAIGVVGGGVIGTSWAAFFASKGFMVKIYDIDKEALRKSLKQARDTMAFMSQKGLMDPRTLDRTDTLLSAAQSLEEVAEGVQWVQESAAENYRVKHQIYQILDTCAPPDAILASSSSGLLMTEIQKAATVPERCLIAHPFNPPHLVPLVELVPGVKTSKGTIGKARSFFERQGKLPVVLKKEVPGHIANRLAAALWREAIHLILEGVASVSDVDRAVSYGPGIRWALMGPHLTYHLGGGEGGIGHFIDHLAPAFESWWQDLACWDEFPRAAKEALTEGIAEEVQGKHPSELVKWRDEKLVRLMKELYS